MAEDQEDAPVFANAEPIIQEIPPSDCLSKRQRRPNVRLNEIGDRPLANVLEYLLKAGRSKSARAGSQRKFSRKPQKHAGGSNIDGHGDAALSRAPRTRPLNHLENGSYANSPSKRRGLMRKRLTSNKDKLGTRKHSDHGIIVRSKRPGNARVRAYEEGRWRIKGIADSPKGKMEDTRGWEHGNSGTEDYVNRVHGNTDFELHDGLEVNEAESSFESDSRDGVRDAADTVAPDRQGADAYQRLPDAGDADKQEESYSDPQMQVPLWQRGIVPLDDKVKDWLQGLGLEKYSFLFQLHEVGSDVLPLLTMDDLKEIGITAVGTRRKLFSEISKLRQGLTLFDYTSFDEK